MAKFALGKKYVKWQLKSAASKRRKTDPAVLAETKKRYGVKYIRGYGMPLKYFSFQPGQKVFFIGEKKAKDFIRALTLTHLRKLKSYGVVVHDYASLTKNPGKMSSLVSYVRRTGPEVVMLAFNGNRDKVSSVAVEMRRLEEEIIKKNAGKFKKMLKKARGKDFVVETFDPAGKEYYLEGSVGAGTADPFPRDVFRETLFKPRRVSGSVYLPPGTPTSEGVVRAGVKMGFEKNFLVAAFPLSTHDKKLLKKVAKKMKTVKPVKVTRLGVSQRTHASFRKAWGKSFLTERVVKAVELCFGENGASFKFSVPKASMKVGGKKVY